MKTRTWDRGGRGTLSFTELGFGTAPIAGLYREVLEEESDATFAAAWEVGIRYYDTAPLYGLGLSETRLNRALRGKEGFVVSSKVGRILKPASPETRDGIGKWFGVPNRREVYDYSYDGTLRSLEFTLERTGLDRIDVVYAHDLDIFNHGTVAALQARLDEFMAGGYRALLELRDQGVIRAFGAGVNEWQPAQWLTERGDFDIFLLAGRYTLLEQEALTSFLPLCTQRGIGVVVGGPYNSGVLATGARPGAFYNYDPAPDWVLAKVARIEAICTEHGVRLVDAAFQFPLCHPAVVSVIPGGVGPDQVQANARAAGAVIPGALWAALKSEGLLREDAPVEVP
ncbi:aldo/keto reductase [Stagnihabitans tardus]|uniref:Aldo/keto reductase n=1 Tax=Stagnihabitans tardus TaxID=2699202 RepID=A0AAE4Y5P4_9RHOB|nr:aldo/keto reductase [Stagnihabitans tardus]NBZ86221.1 aldo/keto reductase [Stagnihabitans tardus]